jgi:branched-chain amino acid transport system permease protein
VFYVQLILNGVIQGLVVGLGALAITLVFGIARFPNAATGDVMTLGAYGALTTQKLTGSLLLGAVGAVVFAAIVSIAAYLTVFRRLSGRAVVASLIASIGLAFLIRALLGVVFGHQQQVFQMPLVRPIVLAGVRINPLDLQLAGVAFACLVVVFCVLYLTPIGRQMRALADDRDLARVSGIRPERIMLALWALAGGVAGVAGMMLGIKTIVTPEIGWESLLPAFAAAIFGGIGSPVGAVLAGLILGVVQEVATPFVGFTYKIALSFVIMLFVLLVRPRGLLGRIEGVR